MKRANPTLRSLGIGASVAALLVVAAVIAFVSLVDTSGRGLKDTLVRLQGAVMSRDFATIEQIVDFDAVGTAYAARLTAYAYLDPSAGVTDPESIKGITKSLEPKLRQALEAGVVAAIKNDRFARDTSVSFASALRDAASKGTVKVDGDGAVVEFSRGDSIVLARGAQGWRVTEYRLSDAEIGKFMAASKGLKVDESQPATQPAPAE